MKKLRLSNLVAFVIILNLITAAAPEHFFELMPAVGQSLNSTATGSVRMDTYAESNYPTTPPGNQRNLYVGKDGINIDPDYYYPKGTCRMFVRFNLPSLPSYAVIDAVRVEMYFYAWGKASSSFGVTAYQITSNWEEYGVTWNNQPSLGSSAGGTTVGLSVGWKSIDITSLAKKWYNGTASNYGISIRANNESAYGGAFYSKEGNSGATPPRLIVTYHVEEPKNNPPVANNQSVTTEEDKPLNITLTASDADGDPLTYKIEKQPLNGSLAGSGPSITYTPKTDYYGSDSFTFSAYDGKDTSNIATVNITVTPVDDTIVRPWTFMIYMAGDNNLEYYMNRAVEYLEDQKANPDVNIVVMIDGSKNKDTLRLLIQPGGNYSEGVNMWHLGELNTGDKQVLVDFVIWARLNFPADNYYLSIANHGRGTDGIAWDDSSHKDHLTTAELGSALETVSNLEKIDVLHYDACLMALFENFYEVKDEADFVVASQNLGWSVFAYDAYSGVRGEMMEAPPYEFAEIATRVDAGTTPRQLAMGIAEAYFNHPAILDYPRTIGVVETSKVDGVNSTLNKLSSDLISKLSDPAMKDEIKDKIRDIRYATQKFDSRDYYKINPDDEYIDLYHFASLIDTYIDDPVIKTDAVNLMAAIDAAVIAEYSESGMWGQDAELYWDLDNAHGLSLYFPPYSNSSVYTRYLSDELFTFTGSTSTWDNFLESYMMEMGLPDDPFEDAGLPPMLNPETIIFLPFITQ